MKQTDFKRRTSVISMQRWGNKCECEMCSSFQSLRKCKRKGSNHPYAFSSTKKTTKAYQSHLQVTRNKFSLQFTTIFRVLFEPSQYCLRRRNGCNLSPKCCVAHVQNNPQSGVSSEMFGRYTLPEINIALEIGVSKKKLVFQPSIFRRYASFREGKYII